MRKYILLLALLAMIAGCDNGSDFDPQQPLTGIWLQTGSGRIVDGNIDTEPHESIEKYTFKKNGKGWLYHYDEFQESFEWSLSGDQLSFTNWKLEVGVYPIVDPGPFYPDGDWTVRLLTPNELTVSYWMLPAPWTEEPAYEMVLVFSRVK